MRVPQDAGEGQTAAAPREGAPGGRGWVSPGPGASRTPGMAGFGQQGDGPYDGPLLA